MMNLWLRQLNQNTETRVAHDTVMPSFSYANLGYKCAISEPIDTILHTDKGCIPHKYRC